MTVCPGTGQLVKLQYFDTQVRIECHVCGRTMKHHNGKLVRHLFKLPSRRKFMRKKRVGKPPTPRKKECQAGTGICSNELIRTYSVNNSQRAGETFDICGPCTIYLKRGGSKLKEVEK